MDTVYSTLIVDDDAFFQSDWIGVYRDRRAGTAAGLVGLKAPGSSGLK